MFENIIPQNIFDKVNRKYYSHIPKAVNFESIIHNPTLFKNPLKNIAFYTDHGINHAIDVAAQIKPILTAVHKIHIPPRNNKRLSFMEKYGTILALIHDIGMSDVSMFGRAMHGEFVAQEVFTPNFESIFSSMWKENIGNIPQLLLYMHHDGIIQEPPKLVFRELLSLACCHRKLLVPVNILNNPETLRKQMQYFIANTLQQQYQAKEIEAVETPHKEVTNKKIQKQLAHYYSDFATDSFKWLLSTNAKAKKFIADIIDTLRILRCADALRQRGTYLKTSAQFQIFVSQFSANSIYALRSKSGNMYFLEIDDETANGEANIANIAFMKEGDLRFEFHRGLFRLPKAMEHGIDALTKLIIQLDYDIFDTFLRPTNDVENFKPQKRPKLLLETTSDNPKFTELLLHSIIALKPNLVDIIEVVPSLKNVPLFEYQNYMNGTIINWNNNEKLHFLKKIAAHGHKIEHIDINLAFKNARIIEIKAKKKLCEARTFPGVVYFPLGSGLEGFPIGSSYSPFAATPYVPLGNTGVVRGGERNSTIIAKRNVKLLAIPKDDYLNYWHATYSTDEFARIIAKAKIK